jgi:hypothetical protein
MLSVVVMCGLGSLAEPARAAGSQQSGRAAFEVPRLWEYSAPLIAPEKRDRDPSRAQKDPPWSSTAGSGVLRPSAQAGRLEYCSFEKWDQADRSARTLLPVSRSDYYCAPQVFYFTPHKKWYLVYQMGVPDADKMWVAYSTTTDIAEPNSWTQAMPMLDGGKNDPRQVGGLDYWIICDSSGPVVPDESERQDVAAVDAAGGFSPASITRAASRPKSSGQSHARSREWTST